jgi:hypothetical protein
MARAWDWLVNTQAGADMFDVKVRMAKANERKLRQQYPGLRSLTTLETENMALCLYGPGAGGDNLTKQYYIPQLVNGRWEWVINSANNPTGVEYVSKVRAVVLPL